MDAVRLSACVSQGKIDIGHSRINERKEAAFREITAIVVYT
jgi:hypothetical protein